MPTYRKELVLLLNQVQWNDHENDLTINLAEHENDVLNQLYPEHAKNSVSTIKDKIATLKNKENSLEEQAGDYASATLFISKFEPSIGQNFQVKKNFDISQYNNLDDQKRDKEGEDNNSNDLKNCCVLAYSGDPDDEKNKEIPVIYYFDKEGKCKKLPFDTKSIKEVQKITNDLSENSDIKQKNELLNAVLQKQNQKNMLIFKKTYKEKNKITSRKKELEKKIKFDNFLLAHEFCAYLNANFLFGKKPQGVPDYLTKKTIRAEIQMDQEGNYSVKIPKAYRDFFIKMQGWSNFRKRLRAFWFDISLRWTQKIIKSFGVPFDKNRQSETYVTDYKKALSTLNEQVQLYASPCNNGNIATGFLIKGAPDTKSAIIYLHGNEQYAHDHINTFKEKINEGKITADVILLDQPGYSLSTGEFRTPDDEAESLYYAGLREIEQGKTRITLCGYSLGGLAIAKAVPRLLAYAKKHKKELHINVIAESTMNSIFDHILNGNPFFLPNQRKALQKSYDQTQEKLKALNEKTSWLYNFRKNWNENKLKDLEKQALELEENPERFLGWHRIFRGFAAIIIKPIVFLAGWGFNTADDAKKLPKGATFHTISIVTDSLMAPLAAPASPLYKLNQQFIQKQEKAIERKINKIKDLNKNPQANKEDIEQLNNQIIYKKLLIAETASQQFQIPNPDGKVELLNTRRGNIVYTNNYDLIDNKEYKDCYILFLDHENALHLFDPSSRKQSMTIDATDLENLREQYFQYSTNLMKEDKKFSVKAENLKIPSLRKNLGEHCTPLDKVQSINPKGLGMTADQKRDWVFASDELRESKTKTHLLKPKKPSFFSRFNKKQFDDIPTQDYLDQKANRHKKAVEIGRKIFGNEKIDKISNDVQNEINNKNNI